MYVLNMSDRCAYITADVCPNIDICKEILIVSTKGLISNL